MNDSGYVVFEILLLSGKYCTYQSIMQIIELQSKNGFPCYRPKYTPEYFMKLFDVGNEISFTFKESNYRLSCCRERV